MRMPTVRHRTPLVAMTVFFLGVGFTLALQLRFNFTTSQPVGIYRIVDEPLDRGDLVVVCLQGEASRLALERGYLLHGSCPSGIRPVLKIAAAVGGDTVTLTGDGMTVNGIGLPNSRPRREDRKGRPLPHPLRESLVLAPDEVWLHNPAADSWDSRYFGPVPLATSRWAVARPVLTFTSPGRSQRK